MKKILKIERGGKVFKVLEQIDNDVRVAEWFQYAQFPYFRKLNMWWKLDRCKIVKYKEVK